MRILFGIYLVLQFGLVHGQDDVIKKLRADADRLIKKTADTSSKTWRRGALLGVNLSQGSLSNWAAGGDDFSLSANTNLNLFAIYKKNKHSWDNTFDLNLGYVNTTSQGGRKNDDRFDFLTKYGYSVDPKLNVSSLINLRSQSFKGYTYPGGVKTYSSTFIAPGYVLNSLGLDYRPVNNLSVYFSPLTARWVIVRDTALANRGLYGVTPGKKFNFEFGAFATIAYTRIINKIITYKGRLDLFSNYKHNPWNIDLFMANAFNAKLGKSLAVSWSLDFIYDDDVTLFGPNLRSPALQVKSLIGVGIIKRF
ncbi:MAG: DUF3078 domain-containing protein [Bacteroidota bacterium]